MLHSLGIDRGRTGDREISVNFFSGAPQMGMSTPVIGQYVSLPSSGLTFRKLFLPRAAKNVRQQVITEELSYSLPFPLTEAHYGAVESGEEAWVTVAADSVVQPIKALYPKAHLEAEPLCYLRAAKAAGISQTLVVDFGASKTVFCGIENGQVGTVRVMLRGGEALTQQLADELQLSPDEAELRKCEEGVEHPTVRRFFQELVEEALLPSPLPYRRVLICGGGSATHGLLRLLARLWGDDVDVEPFPLPGMLMPTEHVVAYGAALAGRPNSPRLQMQHSFSQLGSSGGPISLAPIVFTVILMTLMVLGLEIRMAGAKNREQALKTSLASAVSPILPDAENVPQEDLVKTLREQLRRQREVQSSSPSTLMNTLGQSSNSVTAKKDAKLMSIIFDKQILKLEGQAVDLKQSEDIRNSLEKVLENVDQSKTRPAPNGTIFFQIEGQIPKS